MPRAARRRNEEEAPMPEKIQGGFGTVMASGLPYVIVNIIVWPPLLVLFMALHLPLGPG